MYLTQVLAICCLVLFKQIIAAVHTGSLAAELVQEDRNLGGYLEDWLQGTAEASGSYGLILSGYPLVHFEAVSQLVDAFHAHDNAEIVNIDCAIEEKSCSNILARFSDIATNLKHSSCANRECKLPFAVFFVANGQLLNPEQLEALTSLFRSTSCNVPDHGFWSDCSRVLFVISTDFGHEFMQSVNELEVPMNQATGQPFSVIEYCTERSEYIRKEILRNIRTTWATKQKTYNRIRKGFIPRFLLGNPDPTSVESLLELQDNKRKEKLAALEPPQDIEENFPHNIDMTVFKRNGFVGQEHALREVKKALSVVKNGLKTGEAPLVFLFVGPPGTGKTFLSELIGKAYHGGKLETAELEHQSKYKLISMGNYQSKEEVDGFVGPRPGLQGSGMLVDILSKESRPVIVLDEIEKAHPSLLEVMLLPILDNNGQVLDKKTGKRYSTRDAVFIMTTNCFDDVVVKLASQYGSNGFDKIVKGFTTSFTGSTGCATAHNPTLNPFKEGAVRRRLRNGHKYSNENGFILFLPNTVDGIEQVIEHTMLKVHREYVVAFNKQKTFLNGVYWTRGLFTKIKSASISRYVANPETTSLIVSSVETQMIEPLNKLLGTVEWQGQDPKRLECKPVLFVNRSNSPAAKLYCRDKQNTTMPWVDQSQMPKSAHTNLSESAACINEVEERSGNTDTTDMHGKHDQQLRGTEDVAIDLEQDTEMNLQQMIEARVSKEVELRLQEHLAPYLARIEELEEQLLYWKSLAIAALFALGLVSLIFIWKFSAMAWFAIKVGVLISTAVSIVTVALLYYFGFYWILEQIWELVKFIVFALVTTGWPVLLPVLVLFVWSCYTQREEKRRVELRKKYLCFLAFRSFVVAKQKQHKLSMQLAIDSVSTVKVKTPERSKRVLDCKQLVVGEDKVNPKLDVIDMKQVGTKVKEGEKPKTDHDSVDLKQDTTKVKEDEKPKTDHDSVDLKQDTTKVKEGEKPKTDHDSVDLKQDTTKVKEDEKPKTDHDSVDLKQDTTKVKEDEKSKTDHDSVDLKQDTTKVKEDEKPKTDHDSVDLKQDTTKVKEDEKSKTDHDSVDLKKDEIEAQVFSKPKVIHDNKKQEFKKQTQKPSSTSASSKPINNVMTPAKDVK